MRLRGKLCGGLLASLHLLLKKKKNRANGETTRARNKISTHVWKELEKGVELLQPQGQLPIWRELVEGLDFFFFSIPLSELVIRFL
jgi:hypothetical protein